MRRFTVAASLAVMLVCTSTAFSQLQAISIGGGVVMPSGNFSNFAGTGFGGSVRGFYQYEGLDNLMLTGMIGYYPFGAKEYTLFGLSSGYEYKWKVIPITSGGRYYFGAADAKTRFYAGAELGIHIFSVSVNGSTSVFGNSALSGSTEFALIPMAGAELGPLDLYAEYSLSEFNYFGIKGMFKFSVAKK
jgi:hypothetical protein